MLTRPEYYKARKKTGLSITKNKAKSLGYKAEAKKFGPTAKASYITQLNQGFEFKAKTKAKAIGSKNHGQNRGH